VDRAAVWEVLAGLVAQSLVVAEDHGPETRYRLLETIRQYGDERLDEFAETASLRRQHAEYYVTLGVALRDQLLGPQQLEAATRFNAEQENFSSAMNWAVDTDDVDLAFRLLRAFPAGGLQVGFVRWPSAKPALALTGASEHPDYPFALAIAALEAAFRGDRGPAEALCDQALAAEEHSDPDPERRAERVVGVARMALAFAVGEWHGAAIHSERNAELQRDVDLPALRAMSLSSAAQCHTMAGDPDTAVPLATEALALARQTGVTVEITMSLSALAGALADRDPQRASALLRESRDFSAGHHFENAAEVTQGVLVAARLRERLLALQFAQAAIRHLHWRGQRPQLSGVLNVAAWAIADADPDAAAAIQGAARTLVLADAPAPGALDAHDRDSTAEPMQPTAATFGFLTELRRETTRQLIDALGQERLREQRHQGELMDADQAVAYTLAHIDPAL
jgi:hypothetical protein